METVSQNKLSHEAHLHARAAAHQWVKLYARPAELHRFAKFAASHGAEVGRLPEWPENPGFDFQHPELDPCRAFMMVIDPDWPDRMKEDLFDSSFHDEMDDGPAYMNEFASTVCEMLRLSDLTPDMPNMD